MPSKSFQILNYYFQSEYHIYDILKWVHQVGKWGCMDGRWEYPEIKRIYFFLKKNKEFE